jgi:hypothetical protein
MATPFNGYSLVWYKGEIIGGFERTEDNWAKKSIFATARKRGWVCAAYESFENGPFDYYIGFMEAQSRAPHEFYIIKVNSIPRIGRQDRPVETYLVNDLLP